MKLSLAGYLDGIRSGNRGVLSRAITLVESSREEDGEMAGQLVEACLPQNESSLRVGITGVPGAGKSTFIEALGTHLTRDRGEKVAVLAIDPSSPLSGGSILGDKTRMTKLSVNPDAFIRPSPSSGLPGGVGHKTREVILVCEAAGYRNVLVETVGVGQAETAVASMVDFFLLLALAGAGDELQGIKRGVMELADLIAVNKADGENRLRSEAARSQYENALQLFPAQGSGWKPRAVICSAMTGENIASIWETILAHREQTRGNGSFLERRRQQARAWMMESIEWGLRERFYRTAGVREKLEVLEKDVLEGRVSAPGAALELLCFDVKSESCS